MNERRVSRTGCLIFLVVCVGSAPATRGQTLQSIPTRTYFAAIGALYRGDHQRARKQFESELRGAIKTSQSRWIDSICYHAMLGETYYQLGHNAEALQQFNHAARLQLAYGQWMLSVDFPEIRPDINRARRQFPVWGKSQRNVVLGRLPETIGIQLGKLITENDLQQGGVITPPQIWPINVTEIVRCQALVLRRRNELLGPLAEYDELTTQLLILYRQGVAPPNHWSSGWADLLQGIAEAGVGRVADAHKYLTRSVVLNGQFDHPLTGVALIQQGRLLLADGNVQAAGRLFEEASYAGFYYDNPGIVAEALALGQKAHILAGAVGIYPPLEAAAQWAQRNRWWDVQSNMLILSAESLVAAGQPEAADAVLKSDLPRVFARRKVNGGRLFGKQRAVTAQVELQLNRSAAATEALTDALAYQRASALWNFQISLANTIVDNRRIRGKSVHEVYSLFLGDPTSSDWSIRPMESLGVMVEPHSAAFERWFASALQQREVEKALEVADRAHRRRFLSSLPLGGRLMALRHLLETPEGDLPQQAALQRQDLLVRYPQYRQRATEAEKLYRALKQIPLVPAEDDGKAQQLQQLRQLAAISVAQETNLQQIALGRASADVQFPPTSATADIQKQLTAGEVLILFHEQQGRMYGFALTKQDYNSWQVGLTGDVQRSVSALLNEAGNHSASRAIPAELLSSDSWRTAAAETYNLLLGEAKLDLDKTKLMTIVPDHVTWYVPFEALIERSDPSAATLLERTPIRYVPLAALAVIDSRPLRRVSRTAVVVGKLFPRVDDQVSANAFDQLASVLSTAEAISLPLLAPGRAFSALPDQLIVLDEIETSAAQPYGWSPLGGQSRGTQQATLADWMVLPAAGPQWVMLPGFHTPAESALRSRPRGVRPGDDLFAASCGMLASGARTVLISRWRTGGQAAIELVRELALELPHSPPADAWQRSVLLARETQLSVAAEPRVDQKKDANIALSAKHPFFWAGYMLIDSGLPEVDNADAPKQVAGGN